MNNGQTYKGLIFDELGESIKQIKAEIQKQDEEFNHALGVLERQGHLRLNVKQEDLYGKEMTTNIWTDEAEEFFAPRRRKMQKLEQKLKGAESDLNAKAYKLFNIAKTLDNIEYIKKREEAYKALFNKICEVTPLINELKKHKIEMASYGTQLVSLSCMFYDFFTVVQNQCNKIVNEDALKTEFFKEIENVKLEYKKEKELTGLEELNKN